MEVRFEDRESWAMAVKRKLSWWSLVSIDTESSEIVVEMVLLGADVMVDDEVRASCLWEFEWEEGELGVVSDREIEWQRER